jgi:hypothetical protein
MILNTEHLEDAKDLLLACGIKPYDTVELQEFFASINVKLHLTAVSKSLLRGLMLNHPSALAFFEPPLDVFERSDRTIFKLPSDEPDMKYLCCADIAIEELKTILHSKMTLGAFL